MKQNHEQKKRVPITNANLKAPNFTIDVQTKHNIFHVKENKRK